MSTPAESSTRSSTRALVLQSSGEIRLEELPRPTPRKGEILLRMRLCGLCGTDLFKLRHPGQYAGRVLGHEVVGTVEAVGPGVDQFELGQRVVTPHHVPCGRCRLCRRGNETLCEIFRQDLLRPGGFSGHFVVASRAVTHAARVVPEHMSDETALFLEPGACVLRGIDRSGLLALGNGDGTDLSALILGGGSMGLLHLLLLQAVLPEIRVLVSEPQPERRAAAVRCGAHAAVPPEELADAVAEMSSGPGVDAVFDTVGLPDAIRHAIPLSREGATLVLFAHAEPESELALAHLAFFRSERRLVGTYSGGLGEQARVWDLLLGGRLDPSALVTRRLPLSRFLDGVDLVRGQQTLKVVFAPEPEGPGGLA